MKLELISMLLIVAIVSSAPLVMAQEELRPRPPPKTADAFALAMNTNGEAVICVVNSHTHAASCQNFKVPVGSTINFDLN